MADVWKGITAGIEQGQKLRDDKRVKQAYYANQQATRQMGLLNSAEEEYTKIMSKVESDKWGPEQFKALMGEAQRFDNTYGGVWAGDSAQVMLTKKLHMNEIRRDPETGAALKGRTRMAGYANEQQFHTQNLPRLQEDGMAYLQEHATTNGVLDLEKIALTMLQWETKAMATDQWNTDDVAKVAKSMRDQLKPLVDEFVKNHPSGAAIQEQMDQYSKDMSAWIRGEFTVINENAGAGMTGEGGAEGMFVDSKLQPLVNQLESAAQSMVGMNYKPWVIKVKLLEMYTKNGRWNVDGQDGGKVEPYLAHLADIPAYHHEGIQNAYDMGVDPIKFIPTYNKETGEVSLTWKDGPKGQNNFIIAGPSSPNPIVPASQEEDKGFKSTPGGLFTTGRSGSDPGTEPIGIGGGRGTMGGATGVTGKDVPAGIKNLFQGLTDKKHKFAYKKGENK